MHLKYETTLCHHGVKGQEWGVRNGPPYPIETGMKKGTRVRNVSYNPNADHNKNNKYGLLYTYNANDKWDNKVYKGPFAKYKVSQGESYLRSIGMDGYYAVHEHEYETVKDLKMPTKKRKN